MTTVDLSWKLRAQKAEEELSRLRSQGAGPLGKEIANRIVAHLALKHGEYVGQYWEEIVEIIETPHAPVEGAGQWEAKAREGYMPTGTSNLVIVQSEQVPVLLSVDILYRVSQYLRRDVPLSYLRDWQVEQILNPEGRSAVDVAFLHTFEARYAEYCDFPAPSSDARDGDEFLRKQLHELIGAPSPDYAPTGSVVAGLASPPEAAEALKRYGVHLPPCTNYGTVGNETKECDCGLSAAIEGLASPPEPTRQHARKTLESSSRTDVGPTAPTAHPVEHAGTKSVASPPESASKDIL